LAYVVGVLAPRKACESALPCDQVGGVSGGNAVEVGGEVSVEQRLEDQFRDEVDVAPIDEPAKRLRSGSGSVSASVPTRRSRRVDISERSGRPRWIIDDASPDSEQRPALVLRSRPGETESVDELDELRVRVVVPAGAQVHGWAE